jgi:hypothetical protein
MAIDTDQIIVGGATVSIGGDVGGIKNGINQTPTIDLFTVDGIEQMPVAADAWITNRVFELSFTMVEPTLANIIIAWDLPDAAAGTGPITLDVLTTLTHEPTERAITVTGVVPIAGRFVRTVVWDKCVLTSPAPLYFGKAQETNLEVTFMCLWDSATSMVGDFSDAAA